MGVRKLCGALLSSNVVFFERKTLKKSESEILASIQLQILGMSVNRFKNPTLTPQ